MYLLVDIDKCTGCRTCELACSFRWAKNFCPSESAIAVVKNESKGLNVPVVCQQCTKPVCVDVCISGAIKRDEISGVVTINQLKCRGCKMCITSCPFGAIAFVNESLTARKCDLCNGANPTECMKFCPYNAIEFVSEEKISQRVKRKGVEKYREAINEMFARQLIKQ